MKNIKIHLKPKLERTDEMEGERYKISIPRNLSDVVRFDESIFFFSSIYEISHTHIDRCKGVHMAKESPGIK